MTWQKAQETTAALRRDRGFGQAKGQGKSSGGAKGSGCWICDSNSHFAANCPDKLHPGKGKSRSKFGVSLESDFGFGDYDAMALHGNSKAKKGAHFVDDVFWTSYMKGKNSKGFGKGNPFRPSMPSVRRQLCYTTWTSIPRSSYHRLPLWHTLLHCIFLIGYSSYYHLSHGSFRGFAQQWSDGVRRSRCLRAAPPAEPTPSQPSVCDRDRRRPEPHVSFWSGKWGKALCRDVGSTSAVHVYVLPNPAEFCESWFTLDQLVPILIGMDFIRPQGLILDFSDGLAQITSVANSKPFFMRQNTEGHVVVDLVSWLTGNLETVSHEASSVCTPPRPSCLLRRGELPSC